MDANGQERPIEEDGLGQRETGTGPCEFGFGWFMLEMCFRCRITDIRLVVACMSLVCLMMWAGLPCKCGHHS